MALTKVNQYGAAYVWGFDATDAPSITGAAIRAAQLKYAPEVNDTAMDGEGHVESRVVSKPAYREATGTFTGYVSDADDIETLTDFSWNSQFWVVTSITFDRQKGKNADLSIEAVSNAGVPATSS